MPAWDAVPAPVSIPNLLTFDAVRLALELSQRNAFVDLGQTLIGLGRFADAALIFRLLVCANRRDGYAHRALAVALARLQHNEEALAALDAAIECTPDAPHALAHRAQLRMLSGDRIGARADAEKADAGFGDAQTPLAMRVRILLRSLQAT